MLCCDVAIFFITVAYAEKLLLQYLKFPLLGAILLHSRINIELAKFVLCWYKELASRHTLPCSICFIRIDSRRPGSAVDII